MQFVGDVFLGSIGRGQSYLHDLSSYVTGMHCPREQCEAQVKVVVVFVIIVAFSGLTRQGFLVDLLGCRLQEIPYSRRGGSLSRRRQDASISSAPRDHEHATRPAPAASPNNLNRW